MDKFCGVTWISIVIVAALPLVPIIHFLSFGWEARRQQIISRFSENAIKKYKQVFCPEGDFSTCEDFARRYDMRYGRHLFVRPVLLYFASVIFLTYLCVSWAFAHGWSAEAQGGPQIAVFSLAGAYLWVVNDSIIRARQNDVVTSDINRATLRLFLAVPLGFAIATPFSGMSAGTPVTVGVASLAFFVGAFPTDTVLKFMRRSATKVLNFDTDASGANVDQLTTIDGISVPIAERFIDEGVSTILQLAYTDPIALTIRSGMDFAFVLDCSGQALAAMYFNKYQMIIARKYGLRGSIEIKTLADNLKAAAIATPAPAAAEIPAATTPPSPTPAQLQLQKFAEALQLDQASTRFILDQIAEDPYTLFASHVWGE